MKSRLLFRSMVAVAVALILAGQGCKKDDSPTSPAAPTNNFSFNSDDGNFSANGPFNASATSGSGAGWMTSSTIAAYSIVSPTNVSVVVMMFNATPSVRTFGFNTDVAMTWSLNVNPNDTASIYGSQCMTKSGSVVITAHGSGASQATFGGSGARVRNQADTCAVTNGTFTIYGGSAKVMTLPREVERIARKMVGLIGE